MLFSSCFRENNHIFVEWARFALASHSELMTSSPFPSVYASQQIAGFSLLRISTATACKSFAHQTTRPCTPSPIVKIRLAYICRRPVTSSMQLLSSTIVYKYFAQQMTVVYSRSTRGALVLVNSFTLKDYACLPTASWCSLQTTAIIECKCFESPTACSCSRSAPRAKGPVSSSRPRCAFVAGRRAAVRR